MRSIRCQLLLNLPLPVRCRCPSVVQGRQRWRQRVDPGLPASSLSVPRLQQRKGSGSGTGSCRVIKKGRPHTRMRVRPPFLMTRRVSYFSLTLCPAFPRCGGSRRRSVIRQLQVWHLHALVLLQQLHRDRVAGEHSRRVLQETMEPGGFSLRSTTTPARSGPRCDPYRLCGKPCSLWKQTAPYPTSPFQRLP